MGFYRFNYRVPPIAQLNTARLVHFRADVVQGQCPVRERSEHVELSDGGVYRIFRDRRSENWFADGVYD